MSTLDHNFERSVISCHFHPLMIHMLHSWKSRAHRPLWASTKGLADALTFRFRLSLAGKAIPAQHRTKKHVETCRNMYQSQPQNHWPTQRACSVILQWAHPLQTCSLSSVVDSNGHCHSIAFGLSSWAMMSGPCWSMLDPMIFHFLDHVGACWTHPIERDRTWWNLYTSCPRWLNEIPRGPGLPRNSKGRWWALQDSGSHPAVPSRRWHLG